MSPDLQILTMFEVALISLVRMVYSDVYLLELYISDKIRKILEIDLSESEPKSRT